MQDNVGEWAADTRVQFVFSLSITVNAAVTPLLITFLHLLLITSSLTLYHATLYISAVFAVARFPSVCLSVCIHSSNCSATQQRIKI